MNATLERFEPIVAGREQLAQPATTAAEATKTWLHFQRERGWRETPRTPVRPWRDAEGL
jgi:hypothetical protein